MEKKYYLGCHVGMNAKNNYLIGSVNDAINNGCDTFMFFTGAPQNTIRTATEKLNINEFKKIVSENNFNLEKIIVHGPYTINLANTIKKETYELGLRLLKEEVQRLEAIGISTLVLHPGAAVGADREVALLSLVKGLNYVFEKLPTTNVKIALETMSGKGTEICINFDEIKFVIDRVNKKENIGVCFDTCHLWDAGYDVKNNFENVLKEFEEKIGIEKLFAIHLNDSKNIQSSHKDRHQNIGYGYLGFETLMNIVHHPKLADIPIILETPWIGDKSPYKEEIQMLRNKKFIDPFKGLIGDDKNA